MSIYNAVRRLPPIWQPSFFSVAKRAVLSRLLEGRTLKTVIEIGSWRGDSTVYFAKRARAFGGMVYAIDQWNWAEGAEGLGIEGLRPPDMTAYQQFLSNMLNAEVSDTVVPLRMSSTEAALSLECPPADLIYVDAGHTVTQCYMDIISYHPRLVKGGLICGDDFDMSSVARAVELSARALSVPFGHSGHIWWLH